jgi:membrane-bound lytic murein transglycosylase D
VEKQFQMTSSRLPTRLFSRLVFIPAVSGLLLLTACASKPAAPELPGATIPIAASAAAPANPVSTVSPNANGAPSAPLQAITTGQVGGLKVMSAEPPKELWDRIRRGYAMPDLQDPLVTDREQWYASRPDYILRMTERSSKYLFHVVEELERRQMPTELALLPFIESAFNPQAVSSAKAAGMWQFMPATGKYFDLKQNAFRDDRRDVLASTRAALDYLQKLYGMFGDWHLALAAYNWGEGSVGRAIARNKKAGLGTGYLDLNMPAETRQYVPKLQAVKNIVANPQGFRAELPMIGNHPYFQQVQLSRDIDVALAAKLADVKLEDFKALNPAAHRPVIIASGTPQILLPWDNAEVFQRNFQAHSQGQLASWTAWTAPTTLGVSEVAKRVGMSENDLRSVNNIPPRMLIKAGSTLLVSRSAKTQSDVAESVVDNAQLSLAPETRTQRTLVKARKGDTLASLAKRYNLSASSVAEWNSLKGTVAFKTGQSVVVFLPVNTKARSQASSRAGATKSGAKGNSSKAVPKAKKR